MHDVIRARLEAIAASTEGYKAVEPPGYFDGDRAGKRRVLDDLRAGRLAGRAAHRTAQLGLESLDGGDTGFALTCLREAQGLAAEAERLRPIKKRRSTPIASAKRRGRKKETEERNRKLAAAVAEQEARGLKGAAAYIAAINKDPDLAAAFKGIQKPAIRKALREARKT